MIKRNMKIIAVLTLVVSLGAGMVISHAAAGAVDSQTFLTINSSNNLKASSSKSVLLPKNKEAAVTLWAEALKRRDGALRYAILTNDLKKQEYAKYSKMNWAIGGSSPWVISYKINEKNKVDDATFEYEIDYTLMDSTKASYDSRENVTVKAFGDNWFVIKHDSYEGLPALTENTNSKFSKVQPRVMDNTLVPRDKQSTVALWADALKERNGGFRFAILTDNLKQHEYDKYSKMNWVIGGSSPQVVSYKISEKNKIDDKTYEYEIDYTLTDSTKTLYTAKELLTTKELGADWFVAKHDNYDYMPYITKNVQ